MEEEEEEDTSCIVQKRNCYGRGIEGGRGVLAPVRDRGAVLRYRRRGMGWGLKKSRRGRGVECRVFGGCGGVW